MREGTGRVGRDMREGMDLGEGPVELNAPTCPMGLGVPCVQTGAPSLLKTPALAGGLPCSLEELAGDGSLELRLTFPRKARR